MKILYFSFTKFVLLLILFDVRIFWTILSFWSIWRDNIWGGPCYSIWVIFTQCVFSLVIVKCKEAMPPNFMIGLHKWLCIIALVPSAIPNQTLFSDSLWYIGYWWCQRWIRRFFSAPIAYWCWKQWKWKFGWLLSVCNFCLLLFALHFSSILNHITWQRFPDDRQVLNCSNFHELRRSSMSNAGNIEGNPLKYGKCKAMRWFCEWFMDIQMQKKITWYRSAAQGNMPAMNQFDGILLSHNSHFFRLYGSSHPIALIAKVRVW
jgi:hypothetical protein